MSDSFFVLKCRHRIVDCQRNFLSRLNNGSMEAHLLAWKPVYKRQSFSKTKAHIH